MIPTDNRLKIAVFIDFDNVEIGVKTTIGGQFDIGLVLEAIKERGEIVTKIAYSDWKRVGDYSRLLTQHAIRMVQRNMTPGGDKNGADITMALDALEMAFTHDHINAFVIVGGDSDFISLVEKLKQYDRKVIVVGGRQFTSATMQQNCHEFIAYENLVSTGRTAPRQHGRGSRPATAGNDIAKALPLVKRALKVLSEREVTPQLGLLKSTLLQLDSTFSEREYGVSSFRDFMEKVAEAGAVTLKQAGRSLLVESREDGEGSADVVQQSSHDGPAHGGPGTGGTSPQSDAEGTDAPAAGPSAEQMAEGIRVVERVLTQSAPRWPMYVRQVKQFLRNGAEGFDERRYGFASLVDLMRACQKEGVVRLERDRQGVMRVFGGAALRPAAVAVEPAGDEAAQALGNWADETMFAEPVLAEPVDETATEPPIIDAEPLDSQAHFMAAIDDQAKRPSPTRARRTPPRAPRKAAPAPPPKAAPVAKAAAPRARRPARRKTPAA